MFTGSPNSKHDGGFTLKQNYGTGTTNSMHSNQNTAPPNRMAITTALALAIACIGFSLAAPPPAANAGNAPNIALTTAPPPATMTIADTGQTLDVTTIAIANAPDVALNNTAPPATISQANANNNEGNVAAATNALNNKANGNQVVAMNNNGNGGAGNGPELAASIANTDANTAQALNNEGRECFGTELTDVNSITANGVGQIDSAANA